MNALTERQRHLLDAIRRSMTDRGYPPTVTELGREVGLASHDAVVRQLQIMQLKGVFEPIPGTSQVRISINYAQETPDGAA